MKTNNSLFAKDLLGIKQTRLDRTGIEQVGLGKTSQTMKINNNFLRKTLNACVSALHRNDCSQPSCTLK